MNLRSVVEFLAIGGILLATGAVGLHMVTRRTPVAHTPAPPSLVVMPSDPPPIAETFQVWIDDRGALMIREPCGARIEVHPHVP
jgi:hypothetical protein